MSYVDNECENGLCKNVRNGDGRHCHISKEIKKPLLYLPPINDRRVLAIFALLFVFYTITFFVGNLESKETFLTLLGTFFSISGVWLTTLIALWAIGVEQGKRRQQKEENKYYTMNLIADLYGLIMQIKLAYHWDVYQNADEERREEMNESIANSIKQSEAVIFGWCSDIQMINLNQYAPPGIKTKVSMIIRTAQKTNLCNTGVVEEVFRRVDELLNTEYMKDIKDGSVIQWVSDIKRNIGKPPNSL